ncbi:GON-4-like protein [Synchiropus splendidus]|uniref:GON-4-like protein n=1 Tax=Synchiropus splendidus TaxID=270530 RepID=UPI00237E0424|nr:GON-4-like protein [Synchiropus splendidus]
MMDAEAVILEICQSSDDEMGRLDIDLDRKSKQLNLTSSNVRTLLHEVITNEHVVAMMKAAIRDTQDLPLFEPKMTRSRLKQAVQQGQSLSWSLAADKSATSKLPQFVDIELEESEDTSDEEYCPDEDEEDDTAEETFLSDADSLASPLRLQGSQHRPPADPTSAEALQASPAPPYLLSAPAESFMERLNAVDRELDCSSAYIYNQNLDRKEEVGDSSGLAFRTRSKLRLDDIPLGQLEAELLPPDITADMYELSGPQKEEDRHWTRWLQGLMAPENDEDGEDEDDPEYNFLEDLDEPDMEDYRTDRAVQIPKKEVNQLLDELFNTLQEDEEAAAEEQGDEQEEEEEAASQNCPKFNIPQALRFDAPLASMLTERRRCVRRQYEAVQQRRALQDTTNQQMEVTPSTRPGALTPVCVSSNQRVPTFRLDQVQKLQLQQQIQQHVQLLTQVHLLSRGVNSLAHEVSITKHYLEELQQFAARQEQLRYRTSFRVCNLKGALELIEEVEQLGGPPSATAPSKRWLPTMNSSTTGPSSSLLPADAAWLFATRPVFLHAELLPVCNFVHTRPQRKVYTSGEDGLIVLALKHFEGTFQPDQLISSYLLRKTRWDFRKRVRDMCKAPHANVIKTFHMHAVIPPLPLACHRVQPTDQRPPVERDTSIMPTWLKNSQQIIQKARLHTGPQRYPPTLPHGCVLRLNPYWQPKPTHPPVRRHKRVFTLAHNASLQPLCPAETQPSTQPVGYLTHIQGSSVPATLPTPVPTGADVIQSHRPEGAKQLFPSQAVSLPLLVPFPTVSPAETTGTITPCSVAPGKLGQTFLQMFLVSNVSPPPSLQQFTSSTQLVEEVNLAEEESSGSTSTLSPASADAEEDNEDAGQEDWTSTGMWSLSGGEAHGEQGGERERGGDVNGEGAGGEAEDQGGGQEEEDEEDGPNEAGDGERDEDREKDKDEDQDKQEEEEEDFDDLTQDEDEEDAMSSASEESVLSVPELQETMKQLTWLASERRLCTDGDSEEDHSPASPCSQEEEEEEEEEGPKEESGDGPSSKAEGDEETPLNEEAPRGGGGGRCSARGRGRSRSLRGRSRQERHSKDTAKLLLLYDENILDNDPLRESKDLAFAQSYLGRVREALHDAPDKMEDFVSLLNRLEQPTVGQEMTSMFRKLRDLLGERTDLLRDFAAFLHPEQALECGLFEEQQAFEHSRRFLRQLEISFGDNPTHYQKIIKALQTGPDLNPASIQELKAQMAALLKGHSHLQTEFWVFFDELRPPPARPAQFEEALWPEEGGGGLDGAEGPGLGSGLLSGFEEVTLPDLEEEEDGHKIQPIAGRRQRKRKVHRNYKDCDWPEKERRCHCHDTKIRRLRRSRCPRCHSNKGSSAVSRAMKSLDPLYAQMSSAHPEKELEVKGDDVGSHTGRSSASWEGPFPLADEKEEEDEEEPDEEDEDEEERKNGKEEESPAVKRSRREEQQQQPPLTLSTTSASACPVTATSPGQAGTSFSLPAPRRPSPPLDLPVCAKNISLTPSGEKVILWTREADRVILTTCQQDGATQDTFQAISNLLGNKTSSEVSRRFRDLMRLFRTAARQASSEDETAPADPPSTQD